MPPDFLAAVLVPLLLVGVPLWIVLASLCCCGKGLGPCGSPALRPEADEARASLLCVRRRHAHELVALLVPAAAECGVCGKLASTAAPSAAGKGADDRLLLACEKCCDPGSGGEPYFECADCHVMRLWTARDERPLRCARAALLNVKHPPRASVSKLGVPGSSFSTRSAYEHSPHNYFCTITALDFTAEGVVLHFKAETIGASLGTLQDPDTSALTLVSELEFAPQCHGPRVAVEKADHRRVVIGTMAFGLRREDVAFMLRDPKRQAITLNFRYGRKSSSGSYREVALCDLRAQIAQLGLADASMAIPWAQDFKPAMATLPTPDEVARAANAFGVVVHVAPGSAAEATGLLVGDRLLSVCGATRSEDVGPALARAAAAAFQTDIDVVRGGVERSLTVRGPDSAGAWFSGRDRWTGPFGVSFCPPTFAIVVAVVEDSAAGAFGLQPGDKVVSLCGARTLDFVHGALEAAKVERAPMQAVVLRGVGAATIVLGLNAELRASTGVQAWLHAAPLAANAFGIVLEEISPFG